MSFGKRWTSLQLAARQLPLCCSQSAHQCIALVIVGQKRLLESLVEVRVAGVALEVKDAEPVEGKLITAVIKLVVLLFQRWGRG